MLRELIQRAFSNITDYVEFGGKNREMKLKDLAELPPEVQRCVAKVTEKPGAYGMARSFELYDSLKALELLGRYLGMFGEKSKEDETEAELTCAQALKMLMDRGYRSINPIAGEYDPQAALPETRSETRKEVNKD